MAIRTYSVGNPQHAVDLVQAAQNQTGQRRTTARVRSMLHARAARALSKTPHGRTACAHELSLARESFARGAHDDDPPWIYWMTEGEIEEACTAARQAFERSSGVDSTRPSGAITGLRKRLKPHRSTPVVRDFLELTA
ncbi:hypothetical protein [Streptosporangium saharense]|uniref:hypothetical protein n=1 Tax=Streptosporangium saharense TaxID=1706840 RepID=UPI00332CE468